MCAPYRAQTSSRIRMSSNISAIIKSIVFMGKAWEFDCFKELFV